MRRDDALLTVASLSVAAFLALAGPSPAVAAADPGSHGNGGNGKSGSSQGGSSRGNSGNGNSGNGTSGNGGSATRGSPARTSSVSGQTNSGSSSNGKGGGNGNGNSGGNGNGNGANAQSNSGSDGPDAAPPMPPNAMVPVVVAEQHTGTTAGRSWWAAPAAPLAVEVHAPAAPHMEGDADLLAADHTGIPVWAAAEPVGLRGDLFGLAGLVLMPLIGLAVGYRQAKAARDIGQTLPG